MERGKKTPEEKIAGQEDSTSTSKNSQRNRESLAILEKEGPSKKLRRSHLNSEDAGFMKRRTRIAKKDKRAGAHEFQKNRKMSKKGKVTATARKQKRARGQHLRDPSSRRNVLISEKEKKSRETHGKYERISGAGDDIMGITRCAEKGKRLYPKRSGAKLTSCSTKGKSAFNLCPMVSSVLRDRPRRA